MALTSTLWVAYLEQGGWVQVLLGNVNEQVALLLHEDDDPGGRVVEGLVGVHDADAYTCRWRFNFDPKINILF